MFTTYVLAAFVIFSGVSCQDDPIVTINQGLVRGTEGAASSGRPFYLFRGIPFAEPPVGPLRFKPPVPAAGWDGIYNATEDPTRCIQMDGGVEDCLYLNVYTPLLPDETTSSLPVMVFIHGGAFYAGEITSRVFGPEYFLEKDIVLVLMAYRLGALGFLSTGDAAAPGNFGLLDQSLALHWVQDNIAAFGGDPTQVLLFGESAGAASVSYQIVSNVQPSSGLFRGAITESGSTLAAFSVQIDPMSWAVKLATQLQCPTDDTTALVDCLRGETAEAITVATGAIGGYDIMLKPFSPVIEDPAYGTFITAQPVDLLRSGNYNQVPLISGVNKDEGDLPYGATQQYYTTIDDTFFDETLPGLLYVLTNYRSNLVNVSYAVKEEYFDKIDVNNDTQVIRTAIDFNSDCSFKAANDEFVRINAGNLLPVYMYTFEYAGFFSRHNYSGEPEITHGDELYYLFNVGIPLNEDDLQISNTMIDMWTNFAINLNPNPIEGVTWIPTSTDSIQYLRIQTELSVQDGYRTEQMSFWNNDVPAIVYG